MLGSWVRTPSGSLEESITYVMLSSFLYVDKRSAYLPFKLFAYLFAAPHFPNESVIKGRFPKLVLKTTLKSIISFQKEILLHDSSTVAVPALGVIMMHRHILSTFSAILLCITPIRRPLNRLALSSAHATSSCSSLWSRCLPVTVTRRTLIYTTGAACPRVAISRITHRQNHNSV